MNCSSCEAITAAIPRVKAQLKKQGRGHIRIGAYANGFVTVKATTDGTMETKVEAGKVSPTSIEYRLDLTPELYRHEAKKWVGLGASIVGGCCGVFPEHINALYNGL